MKNLFTTIVDQIKAKVTSLSTVDIDTGQFKAGVLASQVELPAVLVSISSKSIDEIDCDQDMVGAQIGVRLFYDKSITGRCSDGFDLVDQIAVALRGFSTDQITPLVRVSSVNEESEAGYFVHKMVFEGTYFENF